MTTPTERHTAAIAGHDPFYGDDGTYRRTHAEQIAAAAGQPPNANRTAAPNDPPNPPLETRRPVVPRSHPGHATGHTINDYPPDGLTGGDALEKTIEDAIDAEMSQGLPDFTAPGLTPTERAERQRRAEDVQRNYQPGNDCWADLDTANSILATLLEHGLDLDPGSGPTGYPVMVYPDEPCFVRLTPTQHTHLEGLISPD